MGYHGPHYVSAQNQLNTRPFSGELFRERSLLMKRLLTFLLQTAIVLFGIGVLSFLLWVPLVEGRNVHATLSEIYFQDPFVAFCYAASIPFFIAIYKAFQTLGSVRRAGIASPDVAGSLRIIKYCAVSLVSSVTCAP